MLAAAEGGRQVGQSCLSLFLAAITLTPLQKRSRRSRGSHYYRIPPYREDGKYYGYFKVRLKKNVANYFPEMLAKIKDCQYYNCTHTHEPKCAVKTAMEKGEISILRYTSYLNILQGEEDKYRKDNFR